ncbi:2-dehydropantoate 2-reductase [Catenovulum sp. 2E275]|uniref:ketopantoate reductase family protein n=1 Tax=Catenovulum sp. 2E275 TaxID=2980497 RepID=UPI0021D1E958|nr:2-dehydropantoate 2-reductase [Catenovulum sp. 2E275]MCU4675318.1 2-dehydropantoate 2-reductase [Catenovulum sp. 2E275]
MFSILGCGAIGSLIAFACNQNQLNYQLILRHAGQTFQPVKLDTRLISNRSTVIEFNAPVFNSKSHPQQQKIEHLILPIKAYQVKPALQNLKPYLAKNVNIILLHNGLGTAQIARQLIPTANIILASTTLGAYQTNSFETVQTALGETYFGGDDNHKLMPQWLAPLINAVKPAFWDHNIQSRLWQKLAVNVVINPLTALNQVKNGALLKAEYQGVIRHLIDEFCLVSQAEGFNFTEQQISDLVYAVAENTAENYSSMNRDIYFNRQTEIDFINGFLIKKAAEHKIALPYHQNLFDQIRLK